MTTKNSFNGNKNSHHGGKKSKNNSNGTQQKTDHPKPDIHQDNKSSSDASNGQSQKHSYSYRDFSHIKAKAPIHLYSTQWDPKENAPQKLNVKLNAMLSDKTLSAIITWLPHGRSWKIMDPKLFTKDALPRYFGHSNVDSFLRLVNAWGFRRVPSGIDQDSYYHELFLRGMPHLHTRMKRLTKDQVKTPVLLENQCPNFYEMPLLPENPLTTEKDSSGGWASSSGTGSTVSKDETSQSFGGLNKALDASPQRQNLTNASPCTNKAAQQCPNFPIFQHQISQRQPEHMQPSQLSRTPHLGVFPIPKEAQQIFAADGTLRPSLAQIQPQHRNFLDSSTPLSNIQISTSETGQDGRLSQNSSPTADVPAFMARLKSLLQSQVPLNVVPQTNALLIDVITSLLLNQDGNQNGSSFEQALQLLNFAAGPCGSGGQQIRRSLMSFSVGHAHAIVHGLSVYSSNGRRY